jgi:hypothetical protein
MSREFPKNNSPENSAPKNIALPTVGRNVHVWPIYATEPLAGIVALVQNDGLTINVGVFNPDGNVGGMVAVPHKSTCGSKQPYWDWMEFQKGQSAKNEALEAALKEQAANPLKATPDHKA